MKGLSRTGVFGPEKGLQIVDYGSLINHLHKV